MGTPHFISISIDLLKLLTPILIVFFSSCLFLKKLEVNNFIDKLLAVFLFGWAQIILSIEVLSLLKAITFTNLYIVHSLFLLVSAALYLFSKKHLKISFSLFFHNLKNSLKGIKLNKTLKIIICIWLIIIFLTIIYFGLNIPPYESDAMAYHLTRAAFWMQNQSINHYFTYDVRQTVFPVNTELGQLWIMIFTKSDSLVFLVQFLSFIFLLLALYKILRTLNFNKSISIFSVFVFSCLDVILLQSYSPQNDLTAAAFLAVTVYFLLKVLKENSTNLFSFICIGISAAIAIGVKGYVYLYILGIAIFVLAYKKFNLLKLKKIFLILIFSLAGIILFSSYNLISNYIQYGNPIVDDITVNFMRVSSPSIKTFISNFFRHIFSFYQFNGQDFSTISIVNQKIFYGVHNILNINLPASVIDRVNYPFSFSANPLDSDLSYYGLIGYFFILPSLFFSTLFFIFDKKLKTNPDYFNKFKDCLYISIIPAIFFISYISIFKWQPWCGRFFMAFMLILMADFALLIEIIFKYKKKIIAVILISFIISISIFNSFFVLFKNEKINMFSRYGHSVFLADYNDRRYFNSGEKAQKYLNLKNFTDKNVSQNANLGISLPSVDWTYVLFSDKYQRTLKYIPKEEILNKNITDILKKYGLNALLIKTKEKDSGAPDTDNILFKADVYNKLQGKNFIIFNDYFLILND